jgi:hypothetical protein
MLQTLLIFLINMLLYACIGMLAGVAITYYRELDVQLFSLLCRGALTGIVIGTITKFSVVLLRRTVKSSRWLLYCLMLLVAGGLTLAASYSLDLPTQLPALAIVEPMAFLTIYLNIRYFHQLNAGLKRKQSTLTQKADRKVPS